MPIELPQHFAQAFELVPVDTARVVSHKVIYVLGQRSGGRTSLDSRSGHPHAITSIASPPVLSTAGHARPFG